MGMKEEIEFYTPYFLAMPSYIEAGADSEQK